MADTSEKPVGGVDTLKNVLVERELEKYAFPTKYVGFVDMLGFSALTKQFPGTMTLKENEDSSLSAGTSKSAERFGHFHAILDRMAADQADASHPERMMIFSDCAFAVYKNALQAVVSLAPLMRLCVSVGIPVRMGIAKGTCHFQRFGIDSYEFFSVTRAMFYGTGIVYATEAEKYGGKGCRIFLHPSIELDDLNLIHGRYRTLPLSTPSKHSQHEVNYLHEEQPDAGTPLTEQPDLRLWQGLLYAQSQLPEPVDPDVRRHYDDSFIAFNAMRQQHGREVIPAPILSPLK